MLTLNEHTQLVADIDILDSQFTDDVIAKGEYYEIKEDPITLQTKVTIFDGSGAAIASATVEDLDTAIVYMEEVFGLEEVEVEDVDPVHAAVNSPWGHASAGNRSTN